MYEFWLMNVVMKYKGREMIKKDIIYMLRIIYFVDLKLREFCLGIWFLIIVL